MEIFHNARIEERREKSRKGKNRERIRFINDDEVHGATAVSVVLVDARGREGEG